MRILTYNIRGCLGLDDRRNIERTAAVIRDSAADVVCLQEVHQRLAWSGFRDQPRRLAKLTGLKVFFQKTINFGFSGYGIAIATRLPIIRVRRRRLPARGEPRGFLEIWLKTDDGPVCVICTHLGLSGNQRLKQAGRIADRISRIDMPVLLAGDLNERPEGQAVGRLLREGKLRDVSIVGRPTYPADAPRARIDFVLHTPNIIIRDVRTPATLASDHLPVIVDWILAAGKEVLPPPVPLTSAEVSGE